MNTNVFSIIKSHLSILQVVGEYITVKKAGNYWKGHCPFHQEKTASFTVSPDKGIFYCFGCHVNGDVITFIEKIESCTAREAVTFLIDRYQITVPEQLYLERSSEKSHAHKKEYFDLCTYIANWCHQQLKKSPLIIEYIKQRNIDEASVNRFTLGYFPGGLSAMKHFLHDMNTHHILAKDLLHAHILLQGKKVLYSPFEERLIFPIKDHMGRICGFGGRIFKEHDQRPKYYNSHETEFFNKGSMLFGLDLAKSTIQKTGAVFLVEGYIDCIAMAQAGFLNTVATLGTACSTEHLRVLARYAHTLYILYDQDRAGHQAILRLAHLCWQESLDPYVVQLPAGEDPASFIYKNGNLSSCIDQAVDIFTFFITAIGTEFLKKPLQQKLETARDILYALCPIQDELKQELLLHTAAQTMKIPFEIIHKEFTRLKSKQKEPQSSVPFDQNPPEKAALLAESVFSAILNNTLLCNQVNIDYLAACMPDQWGTILTKLAQKQKEEPSINFMRLFEMLSEEERLIVSKYVTQEKYSVSEQDFHQLVLQLYRKEWKMLVNSMKANLQESSGSITIEEQQQILNRFLDLQKTMLQNTIYTKSKGGLHD